jgi:hypothetical protein
MNARASENYLATSRSSSASKSVEIYWGRLYLGPNLVSFNLVCTVGKQTHDLTVIASDSKTTQSGGDNRKKFPLGAALQVPPNFSFAPL